MANTYICPANNDFDLESGFAHGQNNFLPHIDS